jgi:3-oxoacyl-[acyl-carrier protein] reductase
MDLGLAGSVALVTGASRGIGLATARCFAAEGCHLVLSARSEPDLARAATELRATAQSVTTVVADATKPGDAEKLIEAAARAHGGIDILINNVGGGSGGRRIGDSTDDEWRNTLEINLLQTVRMMRLAAPHMANRKAAAIVNIASVSGWVPQLAGSGQYGAAKAALIFNTELWALDLWSHKIRVNTVSPGSILIEGNGWDRYRKSEPQGYADYVAGGFPMNRLGTGEEVADVIVFLASPRAYWINGRNLPVDGLEQPFPAPGRRPW